MLSVLRCKQHLHASSALYAGRGVKAHAFYSL